MATHQSNDEVKTDSFLVNRTTIFEVDPRIPDPSQCCTLREYPSDKVASWLQDACTTVTTTSTNQSLGQVKLVLVNLDSHLWDSHQQPFDLLKDLIGILGIPYQEFNTDELVEYKFYPASPDSYAQQSSLDTPIKRGSVVLINEGIGWSHFTSCGCTFGFAWHYGSRNEGTMAYAVSHIAEYRSIASHPSLLPLLELQSLTASLKGWEEFLERSIRDAQIKSGFHSYATDQKTGVPSEDVDLGLLSAQVSGLAANISTEELCVRGLLSLAAAIKTENASLVLHGLSPEQVRAAQLFVDAQIVFLERQCDILVLRAQTWQRTASTVLSGLFNLIAQRDQMANFSIARESAKLAEQGQQIALKSAELAEETKKDSASMKAIAAVTMCFLPGTFVASFLAMPIFQLNPDSEALTTHQMWLYWTITVPLTLVTIGAWFLWDRWSNHQRLLKVFASAREKGEMDRS